MRQKFESQSANNNTPNETVAHNGENSFNYPAHLDSPVEGIVLVHLSVLLCEQKNSKTAAWIIINFIGGG